MNDTTPPSDPTQGPPNPQPSAGSRFFAWVRGLDITRDDDRWLAGVAAGIANKANIDPIIVRGVFVVLALLGGPGVLLYIAAWLLLPDARGRIHLEQIFHGQASAAAVVGAVLLGVFVVIPLLIWSTRIVFGGPWGWGSDLLPDWLVLVFGILWWAVLVPAGIVWLIVWLSTGAGRKSAAASGTKPAAGPHTQAAYAAQPGQPTPTTEPTPASTSSFAEQVDQTADEWSAKAEQWGERIDEKSHEWEQWGHEYNERHRLGAGFVAISLALALLAGGVAAAAAVTLQATPNTTLIIGLVAAVVVLALAMIVAGIRGRDSGWVGFFAFCGVIALIFAPFSGLLPKHTEVVPFGHTAIYSTDSSGDRAVLMIAGNATVDLEDLTSRADARFIDVWLLAGNVTVRLPETHPTQVQLGNLAGNVRDMRLDEGDRRHGGIFVNRSVTSNTEGVAGSDISTVRVRLGFGNIYIEDRFSERGMNIDRDRENSRDREINREIERLREELENLENAR